MRRLVPFFVGLAFCVSAFGLGAHAQAPVAGPVAVGSPMPDFTLPSYQGGTFTLSALKGKTVVLVFARGHSAPGAWCHICNYQHSEMVEYEAARQFRKRANVEILFVLPYAKDEVADWIDKYPQQLADIEGYKNPPDPSKLDEAGRQRMERARRIYPRTFKVTKGQVPTPFPILLDADRAVSKGLGLFTTEWGGSRVDQNVPTVFVIDAAGVVQFKYFSQSTVDRPGVEHLARVVEWVNASAARPAK